MATTAAIPTPGVQSANLKVPATASSTTSKLPTANKPRLQPRSSTSTAQTTARRPVRSVSIDYLSDKATAAFIRRTLCAQHLADKGRNSPAPIEELLPPLTSRNDVDLQLYALISVILREFVQKWYNNITADESFVSEIVQIIAHCTRALEERLRHVDLESLLFDELPELLDAHIRAYRTAQTSAARPPLESSHRQIYHSLCPLPALSPTPNPDDARSIQAQADNETAYRQLLVQGVLVLLLPTEDLENECLTSLVSQIFSELIIGNLVANKLSEPWLLLEIFIMLTRLAKGSSEPTNLDVSHDAIESDKEPLSSKTPPPATSRNSSFQSLFWSLVQWCFLSVNIIRVFINTLVLSRSLPPRNAILFVRKSQTGQYSSDKSYQPLPISDPQCVPVKVPIVNFKIWPCIANLLEMDARMPWLGGALSMLQWITTRGPGRIAGYDGIVDRLISYHIHTSMLVPDRLPPLLRSIRAALFPNNAPGTSNLVAPSSEQELIALRHRCASAIWAAMPKSVGRLYYGSLSFWPSAGRSMPNIPQTEANVSTSRLGTLHKKSSESEVRSQQVNDKGQLLPDVTDMQESGVKRLTNDGKQDDTSIDERTNSVGKDKLFSSLSPSEDEERILSQIESGILDLFSDAYCNKHLVYGMLELVLVRLMPELADKGIIELWEERLH